MKIMIVTEAWNPQINGVVRTLKMTTRQLTDLGHEVQMLTPDQFFNIPCPTYPEIRLTIASTHKVRKKIDEFKPDVLHIATALHLGAREFLTFDRNQKKLAEAEGLKVPL